MQWLDTQVLTVAVMFLTGATLGLLFDLWGVATGRVDLAPAGSAGRSRRPGGRPTSPLSDLLFWLVVTPLVFTAALVANRGELRSFIFIGLGLGVAAYAVLARRLFVRAAVEVRNGLLKVAAAFGRWTGRWVARPGRLAGRLAGGAAEAAWRWSGGTARRLPGLVLAGFRRRPRNRPSG